MSNKKWYEDMPPQGILCKDNELHAIVVITKVIDGFGVTEKGIVISIDRLEPVTAKEWWLFAPWQSIETAPIDAPILIIAKEGVVQDAIYAVNEKNEVYLWFNEEVMEYITEIDKWLPLPKSNHE